MRGRSVCARALGHELKLGWGSQAGRADWQACLCAGRRMGAVQGDYRARHQGCRLREGGQGQG
eukprot:scaffold142255_cov30-Tisochrysis_lutea.AAC.4